MRRLYLIRHGKPEFEGKDAYCIGRTDVSLGVYGRMQAALLGIALKNRNIQSVFSSPLQRSLQTAGYIGSEPSICYGLEELDMGAWDGLAFQEIRRVYPALYRLRGLDPARHIPPGAEALEDAQCRISSAVMGLITKTQGDIAIVAHAGVNRLLLCKLMHAPLKDFLSIPQPYGCMNTLLYENETLSVEKVGEQPVPELQDVDCIALLHAADTPDTVIKHSLAVAAHVADLAALLPQCKLDTNMLLCAALLHDIARQEKEHAAIGAQRLRGLGYEQIASIIEVHHDLPEPITGSIAAAELLFLADKLTLGTKRVTLGERFEKSRMKSNTAEARNIHQKRYEQTIKIQSIMEQLITTPTADISGNAGTTGAYN